jgi:1-acyl-sn-glycerol-3-phosphate acyltransferase
MHWLFHLVAYCAGKLLVNSLFGCVARVRVLGRENANRTGGPARSATALQAGFLLAANHISHFDPFLISLAMRRKIDWMTMAEFFRFPIVGFFLRAVDAFPAERDRADRQTIRTAIERLKGGRVVGLFPEGGIRDGAHSLLEGAPLRPGAATLAHIARVPIIPCVILGSDRFYSTKGWLPLRRTPVWIAFGNPVSHFPELPKSEARERIKSELAAEFKNLYAQLRETFQLTPDDLPRPPQERMKARRHPEPFHSAQDRLCRGILLQRSNLTPRDSSTSLDGACPERNRRARNDTLRRASATAIDSLLCASLNLLHTRHRLNGRSGEAMERYVAECEQLTLQDYYGPPDDGDSSSELETTFATMLSDGCANLAWRSPVNTPFTANNVAHAEFFPCTQGPTAPTVFLLHALMSTSPVGYRRCANRFKELGWSTCFLHLPYHFSRVPRGYWNGELAITCDLVRNAEGLRQGVIELRQLISTLRIGGCREFGVLATSYGGWIGALLAMVESDLRFVALMAPIVNIEHAIWASPAARVIRRELHRANIEPSLVARHFHLSSPSHCQPVCDPARVLFVTGDFDAIAPSDEIEAIHQKWRGSELLRVQQGHFGYRMMPETIARLKQRGDL